MKTRDITKFLIPFGAVVACVVVFSSIANYLVFYSSTHTIKEYLFSYWNKSPLEVSAGDVKGFTSARGLHRTKLTKTVFGYFPYWVSQDTYIDWEALSHMAYFSSVATTNGTLNHRVWPQTKLIADAKRHDVKFLLTISNFNPGELDTILSNNTVRNQLIDNIIAEVNKYNLDGVSIDFETPNPSQAQNFNVFFGTLRQRLKSIDDKKELHIATWPVDWAPENYDYTSVTGLADGLFIMSYNYHWKGSGRAGPVSILEGPKWGTYNLRWTINDYLRNKTNNRNDKIILGLPYYGLDWQTQSSSVPSNTLSQAKSHSYSGAKSYAVANGRRWDNDSKNPYVVYTEGGVTRQLWYDDAESLSYKYQLAIDNNLQGVGIWALGFDAGNNELWQVIRNYFSIPVSDVNVDRKVNDTDMNLLIGKVSDSDPTLDINSDGVINSIDFSYILTQWGDYPLPPRK